MSATAPVLVVGAGLAGTLVAARLHALGVPVRVVADRPGATILHGGGWLLGRETLRRGEPESDAGADLDADLDAAIDFARAGLPSLALTEGSFELPDVDGARRLCELAPATHAVVEGFGPRRAVADLVPVGHPFAAMQTRGTPVAVEWPAFPDVFGRSFASVAHRLEADPAEPARLIEALKRALRGSTFDALLLPPVLGIERTESLRVQLEQALGLAVGEALDTLPSTPGFRLHAALATWLRTLGVPVQVARVSALSLDPLGLRVGDLLLPASAVVLATGRYLSGGLTVYPDVNEPLAGLTLVPDVPTNPLRSVRLDGPYDGRFFETGVACDRASRAIGPDAEPVHPAVFAVGDLLGGADGLSQAHASGRCLTSAWRAARAIAAGRPASEVG